MSTPQHAAKAQLELQQCTGRGPSARAGRAGRQCVARRWCSFYLLTVLPCAALCAAQELRGIELRVSPASATLLCMHARSGAICTRIHAHTGSHARTRTMHAASHVCAAVVCVSWFQRVRYRTRAHRADRAGVALAPLRRPAYTPPERRQARVGPTGALGCAVSWARRRAGSTLVARTIKYLGTVRQGAVAASDRPQLLVSAIY